MGLRGGQEPDQQGFPVLLKIWRRADMLVIVFVCKAPLGSRKESTFSRKGSLAFVGFSVEMCEDLFSRKACPI